MVGLDGGLPTPFRCTAVCIGATIVLPVASWERRFISEQQLINFAARDDSSLGEVEVSSGDVGVDNGSSEEDGSGSISADNSSAERITNADGSYGRMLISSTHHRFAGLFTIRRPGAPSVTQLLVRGLAEHSQQSG